MEDFMIIVFALAIMLMASYGITDIMVNVNGPYDSDIVVIEDRNCLALDLHGDNEEERTFCEVKVEKKVRIIEDGE